jgi:hypothetical protein
VKCVLLTDFAYGEVYGLSKAGQALLHDATATLPPLRLSQELIAAESEARGANMSSASSGVVAGSTGCGVGFQVEADMSPKEKTLFDRLCR